MSGTSTATKSCGCYSHKSLDFGAMPDAASPDDAKKGEAAKPETIQVMNVSVENPQNNETCREKMIRH